MPEELQSITAQELLLKPMKPRSWIIQDFLPTGETVLAGTPKVGKSWLVFDLALCVSKGEPFFGHETNEAGVLYLCLEDTYNRVQQRLFLLTETANDNLHFVRSSEGLQSGLLDQLEMFVSRFPETRLIIVDTLQMIRGNGSADNSNSYASDYSDMRSIKQFADEKDIALVLVHHTRKMRDPFNVFNDVSGTNGIMGSADETMILWKSNFFDDKATLSITGRDVSLAEYKLLLKDFRWTLVEVSGRDAIEERATPDAVLSVLEFMKNKEGGWEGTAGQLLTEAGLSESQIKGNILSKQLNQYSAFLASRGLVYDTHRTSNARIITLTKTAPEEK